jgi:vitamin B12 transporter
MQRLRYTPIAILFSTLFSTSSFAAVNAVEMNTAEDDIVISANRVESKRIESGSSISVLNAQYLKDNQARTVAEVLRDVPGISVANSGGIGKKTSVFIRGAESKNTLVIIDGVEVNNLANLDGDYDFAHLMADDVERIEILKGSQSALWGSDAMGGVINIVTKKGSAGFTPTASLEIGENNYHKENISLSGAKGGSHYSLSASSLKTNGISATATDPDDDSYKNQNINLKVGHQFNDIFAIDGVLRYSDAEAEYDNTYSPGGDNYSTSRQRQAKLNSNLDLLNKQWRNRLSIAFSDSKNEDFSSNSGESQGQKIKTDLQSNYYFNTVNEYTQRLSFIAEHESDKYQSLAMAEEDEIAASGIVLGYGIDWAKTVFFNAAIRRDFNNKFDDTSTHHLDISAWVSAGTRLHASQGSGVKNPNLGQLSGTNTGWGYAGNPDLKPEKSNTWDAGVEYNLADLDGYVDFTYFHSRYTDMHRWSGDYPNSTYTNLTDKATARGVELTANLLVAKAMRINAGYTYMETDDGSADNKQLLRRPKHAASLNSNYKYTDKLSANIGVRYVGERQDVGNITLDDYTLINIGATYQIHQHIAISGRLENAFDKDYEDIAGYNSDPLAAYIGVSFK